MNPVDKYQRQLLEQTRYIYYETPISEATEKAYLATPRHEFVRPYREHGTKQWHAQGANTKIISARSKLGRSQR
jgi:hypothetical protein